MQIFDVANTLDGLNDLEFAELASFNSGSVGAYWTSGGTSPWERHADTDEFLMILEGSVTITVLDSDGGSRSDTISAGQIGIVPQGRWHRHEATGTYREVYVTPGATEHSMEENPRTPAPEARE